MKRTATNTAQPTASLALLDTDQVNVRQRAEERGEVALGDPDGNEAARLAAIPISEGFNLGYCRAKPGKGPMMHNHDTNETFIAMTGVWRASWENEKGETESVDLNPLDVVSFPPGAMPRIPIRC